MNTIYASYGNGNYKVEITVILCGVDLCVCICGGTSYHVGACALGIPRASLDDSQNTSASVSVLTALGHKEDELVKKVAHDLASTFNARVSVSAGLHIENATKDDIKQLIHHYEMAIIDIKKQLQASAKT